MKNAKAVTIILVVAIGVILVGGLFGHAMMMMGDSDPRYFCGTLSNNWSDGDSWWTEATCSGSHGVPDADDPATILTNKTVNVDTTTAVCRNLTVESGATVNVATGKKLTLTPTSGTLTSTITGTIYLQGAASELFADVNDHTIVGTGAIVGQNDTAAIRVASNKTLTLGSTATVRGRLKILTDPPAGGGTTKFVNLGTVNADAAGGTLSVEPFEVDDDSAAQWKVTTTGAKLLWDTYAASLHGNFVVSGGELEVADQLGTFGTLTMTEGRIHVTTVGSAEFNDSP
jgi:hypothetical protein